MRLDMQYLITPIVPGCYIRFTCQECGTSQKVGVHSQFQSFSISGDRCEHCRVIYIDNDEDIAKVIVNAFSKGSFRVDLLTSLENSNANPSKNKTNG